MSLKKELQHRPPPEELVQRHIIKSSSRRAHLDSSASFQVKQDELKRHQAQDALGKQLGRRRGADELVHLNILKGSGRIAVLNPAEGSPALQATTEALKRKHVESAVAKGH
jgi:hypothetical protein